MSRWQNAMQVRFHNTRVAGGSRLKLAVYVADLNQP